MTLLVWRCQLLHSLMRWVYYLRWKVGYTTELEGHLVQNFDRLAWQIYVKAKSLTWLDIKDLWLGKAVSPKYVRKVSDIEYRMKRCEYDEVEYIECKVVKKAKNLK